MVRLGLRLITKLVPINLQRCLGRERSRIQKGTKNFAGNKTGELKMVPKTIPGFVPGN